MAPGLSPRFRDSSKRYRNLPKRSERSLLWLSPPSVLVLPSVPRGFSPLLAVPSLALPHSLLRLPVSSGFSFRVSTSPFSSASLGRPGIRSGSDSTVLRLHSCFSSTLASLPRKEVIQPHLPIRLPCYDFTPVIGLTFDGCPLSVSSPASGAPNSHGVTGGVYKARERIHRGMLIRDY